MTGFYDNVTACDSTADLYDAYYHTIADSEFDPDPFFDSKSRHQPDDHFRCTLDGQEEYRVEISLLDSREKVGPEESEDSEASLDKQSAEVAAAARFISRVDIVILNEPHNTSALLPPSRSRTLTSVRDSVFDSSLRIVKFRSTTKMRVHSWANRSKFVRPPPLQLAQERPSDAETVQTPLPTRTSSKGAPSFDLAGPPDSAKLSVQDIKSPTRATETKAPLAILTPESANDFHFDFCFPTEPRLSRSLSATTTDSQLPTTPSTEPSDDQIRRDIEAFALEQSPFLRSSQRRTRKPPVAHDQYQKQEVERSLPSLPKGGEEEALTLPQTSSETMMLVVPPEPDPVDGPIPMKLNQSRPAEVPEKSEADVQPNLRRKKSIFGWLQKKPEAEVKVDDLIDLYLGEERKESRYAMRRMASRTKTSVFRQRFATDQPPINAG